ncbi:VanW family protein [Mobilitalea sibirica]|uniref:VanW family protein n=1 Tax=Mobilitalea sibirica TaxID=1462919 RepID=A0A8J7HBR3_9FIRM|nr:VanW family protein [Mobilitalea sibirica]MBH1940267.1 VanW family protein [Mobilitalea sibirica]
MLIQFLFLSAFSKEAYHYLDQTVNVNTYYNGIYIDDINLGGLTIDEAKKQLSEARNTNLDEFEIKLEYDNKLWLLDYKDIGASYDIEEKLNQAYQRGRMGSLLQNFIAHKHINSVGYELETEFFYDTVQLSDRLKEIEEELYIEPKDATIEFKPDAKQKFLIKNEHNGLHVEVSDIITEIQDNIANGIYNMHFNLEGEVLNPSVRASDFIGKHEKIVTFGTDLSRSAEGRTFNIVKAASEFNGMVVYPGQVVSFNDTTGERHPSKGYKNAPMISNGRFVDVPGGGVSQTSTTLYNTVIRAGLEVLRYKRHSIPSSYIEMGLDTTVNYNPEIDLEFKNTKDSPIYIRSFYKDKKVFFEIYGEPFPNNGELRFRSELIETIEAPNPTIRKDTEGKYVQYANEEFAYRESRPGYKVKVYKELYENGELVDSSLFDTHYYRPITGITYIGVKEKKED